MNLRNLRPPKSSGWNGKTYDTYNEVAGDAAKQTWDRWHDLARTYAMICSALVSVSSLAVSAVSLIYIVRNS